MVSIKNYVAPTTLEEAYTLNQKKSNRIIAGMLWTKMSNGNINTAIDISNLGLDKIEETEDSFSIYAMTTLRTLETNEALNKCFNNAIKNAVKDIVGVQFRNLATIGGSIYGRYGFSDLLTVFLGLNAKVELFKGGIISLEEYSKKKYDRDLLIRVIVDKNIKTIFKCVRNTKTDFSVLNVCVSKLNDSYFAIVGARPQRAIVIKDELNILKEINDESINKFIEYVKTKTVFHSNIRGSIEYRQRLCEVLIKRALVEYGG